MSTIYLAWSINPTVARTLKDHTSEHCDLLVTFPYVEKYKQREREHKYNVRHRMLDSGAFSAWNSKKTIDIEALIEETKNPYWTEAVALDVIGDADASVKNAHYMRDRGAKVIPVFHIGDPWAHLVEYCRHFEKVGISCRFGEPARESMKFLDGCFARAWPHKFHSFGWVAREPLEKYPFHSADASSWFFAPCVMGRWSGFDYNVARKTKLSVRNYNISIWVEVAEYKRRAEQLAFRWRREMQLLESGASKHGSKEIWNAKIVAAAAASSRQAESTSSH